MNKHKYHVSYNGNLSYTQVACHEINLFVVVDVAAAAMKHHHNRETVNDVLLLFTCKITDLMSVKMNIE